MNYFLVIVLFIPNFANALPSNFELVAENMGYSDKLFFKIKEICDAEKIKINCSQKSLEIYRKLKQNMEAEFLKKFNKKEELAYMEKLFKHDLMIRLNAFKVDYIESANTKTLVTEELQEKSQKPNSIKK